jgi:MFS family permease
MACAPNATFLLMGRFLIGIAIGVSAVVAPAYLGEISPAHTRGRIVESYEILLCVGMFASVLSDVAFQKLENNWRWMVSQQAHRLLILVLI